MSSNGPNLPRLSGRMLRLAAAVMGSPRVGKLLGSPLRRSLGLHVLDAIDLRTTGAEPLVRKRVPR